MAAGTLEVSSALERPALLASPVAGAIRDLGEAEAEHVGVAEIDPELADTAAFCEHYASPPELSANCVVVSGKRSGQVRYAACLVLATTRTDVNGMVKRWLDVRKASFASMDEAVDRTGMEYGGITPFGLPADWPVLIDAEVARGPVIVVGSGLRRSKILTPGEVVSRLPGVEVVTDLARPL